MCLERWSRIRVRVVSLFCGVGGADFGLYAAAKDLGLEVEVVAAYDFDAGAVAIYNANLLHASAVVADVKTMTRDDLPPHDLVIGGPPCQPFSLAGKRAGASDARDCLPDFLRLADGSPYLMENVVPRLIPSVPYSVKLNAFNFGDVTTRKRWFYSSHLLHVVETPGPRRFGDIRDTEADKIAVGRRKHLDKVSPYADADADAFSSLTAHTWHGHDVRSNAKLVEVRPGAGARVAATDAAVLGSVTADSWHGKNMGGTSMVEVGQRSYPQPYTAIPGDGALGFLTSHAHDQPLRAGQSRPTQDDDALGTLTVGKGGVSGFLKVGLRGHSASASASAFDDDQPIGSLIANSWHGNEISRLGPTVRCPSLLEMQRAHSFPDDFDWCGATKTARGRYIANSWPIGMATAVCRAMLVAIGG